jgi:hypothetical protein
MFGYYFYTAVPILIPAVTAIIYLFGYIKLKWEFLWIGFTGACFSSISGFESIYTEIDYDNPEMSDYLMDGMWIVGWSLEVLCLYLIIKKVIEMQSQK